MYNKINGIIKIIELIVVSNTCISGCVYVCMCIGCVFIYLLNRGCKVYIIHCVHNVHNVHCTLYSVQTVQ